MSAGPCAHCLTVPVTRLPVKTQPGYPVKAPLLSSGNKGEERGQSGAREIKRQETGVTVRVTLHGLTVPLPTPILPQTTGIQTETDSITLSVYNRMPPYSLVRLCGG